MKSIPITKVDQKYKFMFNTYSNCIWGEPKPVSRLGKQCNATDMKAVGWKRGRGLVSHLLAKKRKPSEL